MPLTPSALKRQPITLAQLSSYDDILTDALVDHAFYWTTIPKNRPSYHPSRGVTEPEITKIIQSHLVVDPDVDVAESKLLATSGLGRFYRGLKTPKERDDFRAHLRRYMCMYLPECPFEVASTNRYTIFSHEAAVAARKFIKKGQSVKYLSGIQVMISAKEDKELSKRKKDFSIVVSSRNKCAALFMGPARFANHDCNANARLMITGQTGIEIVATKNIDVGDEITVSYAENYFGEDNCECLCKTCEINGLNGWAKTEEGGAALSKSIEEAVPEGYSLRRRRRDESCASASRASSVTPGIRPRIRKTKSKTMKLDSERASHAESPGPERMLQQKRKREYESLQTPPVTPAKKLKSVEHATEQESTLEALALVEVDSSSGAPSPSTTQSGELALTNVTTPEEDFKEPALSSPAPSPVQSEKTAAKQEVTNASSLSNLPYTSSAACIQDTVAEVPLPTIETAAMASGLSNAATFPEEDVQEIPAPDVLSLPPPILSVSDEALASEAMPSAREPAVQEESKITRPRRGRPRKGEERKVEVVNDAPLPKNRTPGDYTLTAALLFEPNTAWIHCTICNEAFVQQNAYYTRSSCPRCERHSKLYGYQWPKTEKEGPNDREERILDHRTIHRFLDADDEAKIRGRRLPSSYAKPYIPVALQPRVPGKRGPGRPRKHRLPQPESDDDDAYVEDKVGNEDGYAGSRSSSRRLNPSFKAAAC
ncbi:hypothetical protein GGR56DRAFT_288035 [Xylariaceae sp. FL0804]|nr:hypothetical protein GGR56DRAFT_288035 [Xylariaceae sp. FL0804]